MGDERKAILIYSFLFNMTPKISTLKMLEAGLHFGHQKSKRHPKIKPYIFTIRNGVCIFDLQKTREALEKALGFIRMVASQNGKIVFLGSKKQAQEIIRQTAEGLRMPYVTKRWLGGTFTNFEVIRKKISRLKLLEEQEKQGEWKKYTKKERLHLKREKEKLRSMVGGIRDLDKLPQAIFIIDVVKEKNAVREARKKGIPIIALVDVNGNPALLDYPIPGNDDALKGIRFICEEVAKAFKEGQQGFPKGRQNF